MTVRSERRPATPGDLRKLRFIEDFALSPDGSSVAVALSTIEGEDDRYRSAIWLVPTAGGTPRRLTFGTGSGDASPRWRPDGGALAFRSDRGAGPQVYVIEIDGGEARPVTALKGGVQSFAWSPDGRRLAVVTTGDAAPDPHPPTRRITKLHYKGDSVGLLTDRRTHLWLVDADGAAPPRQLTDGDEDDVEPVWSPDGATIAFNRSRPSVGGAAPFFDIWTVDLAAGRARNLTNGRGPCFRAAWSPDGSRLAFAGHTEPKDIWWGKNFGIWVMGADGGEPIELTAGYPHICCRAIFGDPWRGVAWPAAHWSATGDSLYFLATVGGQCQVQRVLASGGAITAVTRGRHVVTDVALAGTTLVFGAMASDEPTELWMGGANGAAPRRLTDFNPAARSELAFGQAERIAYQSFDGREIEGWLVPPVDYRPGDGRRYPLLLSIHGGPHAAYGEAFHFSYQTLTGAGWFVLYVNPRGSQGYGEEFARDVIGDWGGGDYRDLLAGVDAVIARGDIDDRRLAAWGASYGGFMTSWIAGHTDRFAAIVSVIPVTDLVSFHGTSDIGHYFTPFEMGDVQPWEDRERYLRHSPLGYVERVVTPLLLVHHEQDLRCPIAQSEQFYAALKALGRTVEFLRIDDASHGIVAPARAHTELIGMEALHDWLRRYAAP